MVYPKSVFSSDILKYTALWLNSFHIYAFTFVSGYIFYYTKYEQGKYNEFKPFIINKAKRLLIPYVAVVLVWIIPIQWLFFRYNLKTVILNYILATNPNQLWFLFMLFNVFVAFWLLSNVFIKYFKISFIIALIFYVIGWAGANVLPDFFMIFTACKYLIFFLIGFKIRQHGSDFIGKVPLMIWVVMDLILFAIVMYLANYDMFIMKLFRLGFMFLLNVVGTCMAFVILQKIARRVNCNNKYFLFISKKAMPIYLFHQQIIYFSIYMLNGVVNPYLNVGINFCVSMILSLIIATVLMQFKITRLLIGEK